MQAVSGLPHCRFVLRCPTDSFQTFPLSNYVSTGISSSHSNPLSVSARASGSSSAHGQNAEEEISKHRDNRRLFLSFASGTALLACLEGNSTAFAAEDGASETGARGSIISEASALGKPAVSELTTDPEDAAIAEQAPAEGNALIRKLLARSKANKEKNDKARLDDYYRRNYREYFEYIEGTIRRKKEEELTEVEKSIIEWLKNNK